MTVSTSTCYSMATVLKAMTFYHKCLGGTLTIATVGDTYERPDVVLPAPQGPQHHTPR